MICAEGGRTNAFGKEAEVAPKRDMEVQDHRPRPAHGSTDRGLPVAQRTLDLAGFSTPVLEGGRAPRSCSLRRHARRSGGIGVARRVDRQDLRPTAHPPTGFPDLSQSADHSRRTCGVGTAAADPGVEHSDRATPSRRRRSSSPGSSWSPERAPQPSAARITEIGRDLAIAPAYDA
jgi:hypothetical protein